ncbi:EAL domain-containing protein [Sulfuricurvum sp.]|uniref:EAL domain-containing protein n=1 Tax=Sulfuricurvum sp. TaxID=2025608 RepID=UPI002620E6E1|nr:EAL domain-containing protein [Sulfuricurvum sp.]MDD4884365.1 EAL domain-containing protein [Sulfuricurvum sp.]
MKSILFSFILLLQLGSLTLLSGKTQKLDVGIISFRPIDQNQKIWQPLADEVHAYNSNLELNLTSGSLSEIERLVAQNRLDFVIVHPAAFIEMEYKYGITNIASLIRQTKPNGEHLIRYGGVIVTLASRKDIATLKDVRGKTIVTTHKEGTAAMLMEQETLMEAGIDIIKECRMVYSGQPTEKVITALREHRADVAFVRTGYIEEMTENGLLKPGELKVIGARNDIGFPYLHSTRLYPEWAVASTNRPDVRTIKAFTVALYHIHTDASKDFHEFSIPLSYQGVRTLMEKFHVYPFDRSPTFLEFVKENSLIVIGFFALIAFGSGLFTLYYFFSSRTLVKHSKQIETIMATAGDGIHVHDQDGNLILFSDSFASMLGYTREELSELSLEDWDHHFSSDKISSLAEQIIQNRTTFETRHTRKDGTIIDVEINAKSIMIDNKRYFFASSRDITEQKRINAELLRHNIIFQNIAEGGYAVDTDNRCTYINPAGMQLLGWNQSEVLGKIPHTLFHHHHFADADYPIDECPIVLAIRTGNSTTLEEVFIRKDKSIFPVNVTVAPIYENGTLVGSVITFEDITIQKIHQNTLIQEKERFNYMAYHDPLTDLPNRLYLVEYLQEQIARPNHTFALIFLDLDGFKVINDSYGHRFGDQILIQFTRLLQSVMPENTFIVRTGGDEFVTILPYDTDTLLSHLQTLINRLNQPFYVNQVEIYITASIGIAAYPSDASTSEELLQNADAAMYEAKRKGKNTYSFYQNELTANALSRTILTTNLKKALQNHGLSLYYQPQIDVKTEKIIGLEALIRWFTPQGAISPGQFIPIAEETGLIVEIGEFVLYEGCKAAVAWANQGILHGHVAINVSARQLMHHNFMNTLDTVIRQTGCNPSYIELEITESSILEQPEKMISMLQIIKSKGFKISIDDFGTGYSSLSYLKNLPIDKLKIDISFIRNITHEPKNQTIVKTIIALAKGLGMSVLAEGVESTEERAFLKTHEVDSIQGFYYYKPISADDITVLLQA